MSYLKIRVSKSEVVTGSGSVISESRKLKDFNKIKLNLAGSLEITQGNDESIKIETDDNILPIIETVVKNGTLKIRTIKGKSFNNATKLKISVNLINLNLVGVYSSGSVNIDSLKTTSLKLIVSGSGSMNIKTLNTDRLKAKISGSGSFNFKSGKARHQIISISGYGSVNSKRFIGETGTVTISGSGSATVNIQKLSSKISGHGSINNVASNDD